LDSLEKAVLVIVVVVVIVASASLIVLMKVNDLGTMQDNGTASPEKTPSRSIEISYVETRKESIKWVIDSFSGEDKPDTGKIFIEVNMTIKNNGYDKFSTNTFYFYVIADNVKFSCDSETYSIGNWDGVDVLDGGIFKGTMLFQIPEAAKSTTIGYESWIDYNIEWIKT
jgi:hypothetical protein